MAFDYFYNQEPEQYVHYQMPTILFEDERLNKLSINAKFLYCLLLDRAKLSYKNGWVDSEGKVYIQFAQSDLTQLLNCGRTKMSEYFGELDGAKGGVGLIERKQKNGIGKSDVIYVKNFAKPLDENNISEDIADGSQYKYFHNMESMRFSHYQIPKMLFVDEKIKGISNTAKMAYSFLLDRSMLSYKNGWKDKDGRIYVQYPQKELQQMLGCSIRTVKSALSELDLNKGVGLIDRTRQGMNNPDLIYVLDYGTELKYSRNNIVETVENKDLNTTVNIGGAKSEHQEVQNLNIGGAKSEHLYINNTNSSHTYFSNTQSVSHIKSSIQEKGQTDRQTNQIKFSSIINAIGFDFERHISFEPETEHDLSELNEANRNTQQCKIPYILMSDKKALSEALKFLFSYSHYVTGMPETTKRLLDMVIASITEMVEKDTQKFDKTIVKNTDIIDRINDVVLNSSLIDWFYSFENEWTKIISENSIKNQRAYMKSCIWNWLFDYRFIEDNDIRILDRQQKTRSKSKGELIAEKYSIFTQM